MNAALPQQIESVQQLEDVLTMPSTGLVEQMRNWEGDLLILGVAGKMGPTLARLARRAMDAAGNRNRVIGVARFSDPDVRERLENGGVSTIAADLLDDAALASLPDAPNVCHMAARKFGSTGDEALTWAMNTYLPGRVAERFRSARIVTLSTGNVYPLTPVARGGPSEAEPVDPVGEYAQSCLGRERMFEHFSRRFGTLVSIVRLNYANDLRYGVLVDIAHRVNEGQPINLAMGYVNVIWQGDANEAILRCFRYCASPPFVLNLTGQETLSVRAMAERFGRLLGKTPRFIGTEQPTALLSNAARYHALMGPPRVDLDRLVEWTAHWVRIGGSTLNKPTHYDARDGKF